MMKSRPGCIIKNLKLKTTLRMNKEDLLKIERWKAGNQGLVTQSRLRVQDKIGTTMESCSRSFTIRSWLGGSQHPAATASDELKDEKSFKLFLKQYIIVMC